MVTHILSDTVPALTSLGQLPVAGQFGLGAAQFLISQPLLGQALGLVEQLLLHLGGRLGGGSGELFLPEIDVPRFGVERSMRFTT